MYSVLLVDDDPSIIDGLKIVVNWDEMGLEIGGTAYSGMEALKVIKESKIDILVTDIRMPLMSGLELIKKTRELNPDIMIIILSGYDDFDYVKESLKYGVENYLLKPVNEEELASTLLTVIDKLDNEASKKLKLKNNINVIKENTLLRWVTNTISANNLEERAALLGLNLSAESFLVCIIKVMGINSIYAEADGDKHDNAKNKIIALIEKSIKNYLYVFNNLDNDIVIIFYSVNGKINIQDIVFKIDKCVKMYAESSLSGLFITLGSLQKDPYQVWKSYRDALALMDYSIVMPVNSIVEYNNAISKSQKIKTDFKIDTNTIRDLLYEKNKAKTIRYIDDIFSNFNKPHPLLPSQAKSIAVEMVFICLTCAELPLTMSRTLIGDNIDLATSVYRVETLDELKAIVKSAALRIISHMHTSTNNMSPVVAKVVRTIETQYQKDVSLKLLASSLNINPVYLGQIFKNETGELFSHYLNRVRIAKAKHLLLSSGMPVSKIATYAGYNNMNNFLDNFKKFTGMNPSEYRKANLVI